MGDMREPGEEAELQKWIARHPRQINKQYGAFCETLPHVAAKWGREDLAELLIAGGARDRYTLRASRRTWDAGE